MIDDFVATVNDPVQGSTISQSSADTLSQAATDHLNQKMQQAQDRFQTLGSTVSQKQATSDNHYQTSINLLTAAAKNQLNALQASDAQAQNQIETAFQNQDHTDEQAAHAAFDQSQTQFNTASQSANQAYNNQVLTAQQSLDSETTSINNTLNATSQQTEATYQSASQAADTTLNAALDAADASVSAAEHAADLQNQATADQLQSTVDSAVAGLQTTRDSAKNSATAAAQQVLAQHPGVTYDPGVADSSSTFQAAASSADYAWNTSLTAADDAFADAVDGAIDTYQSAAAGAQATYDAAEHAEENTLLAAVATAQASHDSQLNQLTTAYNQTTQQIQNQMLAAQNAAQAIFNTSSQQANSIRDASVQSARQNYDQAVATLEAQYNTTAQNLQNQNLGQQNARTTVYGTALAGAEASFRAILQSLQDTYNKAAASAQSDYNTALEAAKQIVESAESSAFETYEIEFQQAQAEADYQRTLLFFDQQGLMQVYKNISVSMAQAMAVRNSNSGKAYVAGTIAERNAMEALTLAISDASYSQVTDSAEPAYNFAELAADLQKQYRDDLADMDASLATALATARAPIDKAIATKQKILDEAVADANKLCSDSLADAQYTLDLSMNAIDESFTKQFAANDDAYATAVSPLEEQLANAIAAADVAKANALFVPYIALGTQLNTAEIAMLSQFFSANTAWVNATGAANIAHTNVLETARAAAIAAHYQGDPESAAITALANANATRQISLITADANFDSGVAQQIQNAGYLQGLAWKITADSTVMVSAQAMIGEAVAEQSWVSAVAAASHAADDLDAAAQTQATGDTAAVIHTFSDKEALYARNATKALATAGKVQDYADALTQKNWTDKQVDNSLDRNLADISRNKTESKAELLIAANAIKAQAYADMEKTIDDATLRHDSIPNGVKLDKDAAIAVAKANVAKEIASATSKAAELNNLPLSAFEHGIFGWHQTWIWLIGPGLDGAANFMTGWMDALSGGTWSYAFQGTFVTQYVDVNSGNYRAGQVVGGIHGMLLGAFAGGACSTGAASWLANGYTYFTTAQGMANAGQKFMNGEKLNVWDYLAFAPAVGWTFGKMGKVAGFWGCFIAGTPVVIGWQEPLIVTAAGWEAGSPAEPHSWIVAAGVTLIVAGSLASRRLKRQDEEESGQESFPMPQPRRLPEPLPEPFAIHELPPVTLPYDPVPAASPALACGDLRAEPQGSGRTMNASSRSSFRGALATVVLTASLLLGALCFWQALPASKPPTAALSGSALAVPSAESYSLPATRALKTVPIEQLRPGMRVLAKNPELQGPALPEPKFSNATHRLVSFRMTKPDGSVCEWDRLEAIDELFENVAESLPDNAIILPRPSIGREEDLLLQELLVGRVVEIDLQELGFSGPAEILGLAPCPPIEAKDHTDRRVITATFRHSVKLVYDLSFDDGTQITATGNHPFWSEERKAFVPVDELHLAETVRRADHAVTHVSGLHARANPEPVYNIEVDGEHVYYVGNNGFLVHNACRTYITYTGIDTRNGLTYVGRASGYGTPKQILQRRLSSHDRVFMEGSVNIDKISRSRSAIRGREQQLIEFNRNRGTLTEQINGISDRNPRFRTYMNAATRNWGSL